MSPHEYRICPQCGIFSPATERQHYCVWCGAKLVEECKRCRKPILHPHGKFCYHCGTKYDFPRVQFGSEQPLVRPPEPGARVWDLKERRKLEYSASRKNAVAGRKT